MRPSDWNRCSSPFGIARVTPTTALYCAEGIENEGQLERLRAQVIEPLGRGEPGRYQRYDWYAGELADWVDLPVPEVLLLEGVASGARSLDSYLSLLIWVEVPRAQRRPKSS